LTTIIKIPTQLQGPGFEPNQWHVIDHFMLEFISSIIFKNVGWSSKSFRTSKNKFLTTIRGSSYELR